MSSVSRPTKAGSHSSHPYREASSLKCKTSSFTLVREKNSEPGLHAASPSYDLFGSSEPQESGYTKLPFTVRRWLGDTEGDRLMANLVVPSTFPDYKVAQGPDDPPASSTDKLSDSNETSASYEARASGRAYTQSGTSFHHIGAWCDEKELRQALQGGCNCMAAQRLSQLADILRSSLEDLDGISARFKNTLADIEAAR